MSATDPTGTDMQPAYRPYDDEIDLRQYLDILIAWWKEILLLALLAAVVAGLGVIALRLATPREYAAKADVVMARLISEIALDERVRISGEELGGNTSAISRRAALAELVHSGTIAQTVAGELADLLTQEERDPSTLLDMVSAETPTASDGRTASDLIRITVTADDPDKAAAIANAWAKHYIQQVNAVFGQAPAEVLDSVEAELASASSTHQAAQIALQEYMATSPIDSLRRQINEKAILRDNLQTGKNTILDIIAAQDRTARTQLFTDLTNAQSQGLFSVLAEQTQSRQNELQRLFDNRSIATHQLEQARNLQEQIRTGGDATTATNRLALQLLKTQVFALARTTPPAAAKEDAAVKDENAAAAPTVNLFVTADSAAPPSAADQSADVQALVSTLEQYLTQLDAGIAEMSQSMLSGDGLLFLDQLTTRNLAASTAISPTAQTELDASIMRSYEDLFEIGGLVQTSQLDSPAQGQDSLTQSIDQLDRSIQALRAELAAEDSKYQLLTQRRDVAWNTFDALSNKAAELGMERSAANSEVRMGSPAIPPSEPVSGPSLIVSPAIAGAMGLMIGVFIAFLAHYMGHVPFLRRQRTQPA